MKFRVGDVVTDGYYTQIVMQTGKIFDSYLFLVILPNSNGHKYRFYYEPDSYVDRKYSKID